jgi:ferritin
MSTRKYASGYEKLKKKRKVEKLIESQKGSLNKFVISNKQNINDNLVEKHINEQEIHEKKLDHILFAVNTVSKNLQ